MLELTDADLATANEHLNGRAVSPAPRQQSRAPVTPQLDDDLKNTSRQWARMNVVVRDVEKPNAGAVIGGL